MDIQLIFLVGRATKDAEEYVGKNEKKFSKFSLAVNEYDYLKKEERVTYYDVLIFGKSSEKALERVKKGDKVIVQGKPEAEAYLPKKSKEPKASITVLADSWSVLK